MAGSARIGQFSASGSTYGAPVGIAKPADDVHPKSKAELDAEAAAATALLDEVNNGLVALSGDQASFFVARHTNPLRESFPVKRR